MDDSSTSIAGRKLTNLRTRIGGKTINKAAIIGNKDAFDGLVVELKDKSGVVALKVPLRYILDMTQSNGLGLQFTAFVPDWKKSQIFSYNPGAVVTGEVVELLCEVI
jgi:hypothetical protein